MDIYTSAYLRGNSIHARGYDAQGKRISRRYQYHPYLFIKSKHGNSEFKTLDGTIVDKIEFDSISEARDFVKKYKDIDGFKVWGMDSFIYPFINDTLPKTINYNRDRISVGWWDIESETEGGFGSVDDPWQPITAITLRHGTTRYVFGWYDDYEAEDGSEIIYIRGKDEAEMLRRFIQIWNQLDLDVVTGWNIDGYDIPYTINRIRRVLGEDEAKKLSPWGEIKDGTTTDKYGKEIITREIMGIESMDYMRLFQKFTYTGQESYALNHIAGVVLKDYKVDYTGSLGDLMRNDYKKFITYNVKDVDLVVEIDKKMNLLDQALTVAYMGRVPFQDIFGTVKFWDSMIHWELMSRNIVVPPMKHSTKNDQYAGAYVKIPEKALRKWIASFDVASLYPSLIVWANLSPETSRGKIGKDFSVEDILNRKLDEDVLTLVRDKNLALAANMTTWDRDFIGIFPEIVKKLLEGRSKAKKRMLQAKAENEVSPSKDLEYEIDRLNNLQMAIKIALNSLYGAAGSAYFRYYSLDYAEAITLSGQACIQWLERRLNEYLNRIFQTDGYDYAIYSDTDSLYLSFEPIIDRIFKDKTDATPEQKIKFMDNVCKDKIQPFIESTLLDFADYMNAFDKNAISMKREALGDAGIWSGKKKHYVLSIYNDEGVQYAEPKIKMLGISAVKSSTPKFCREKIKDAIKIMLKKNRADLLEFVEDTRKEFNTLPFEQIASPTNVDGIKTYTDTGPGRYKSKTPGHTKAAILHNYLVKEKKLEKKYPLITDGDKIKYCYLTFPNPIQDGVIASTGALPEEFGLSKYLDYDRQFEKTFINGIKGLAETIGWSLENKSSLEDLFN